MIILKFGGSSVKNAESIKQVVKILKNQYADKNYAVVFSAFGGVTDLLIKISKLAARGDESYLEFFDQFLEIHRQISTELLNKENFESFDPLLQKNHRVLKNLFHGIFLVMEASPRTMDYVLSFGERNSAAVISAYSRQEGLNAKMLDAREIIKTDKKFGSANVDFNLTQKKINKHFTQNTEIQIVTGFISSAKGGLTTTLGRGGSDYTASILASSLNAEVVHIWTDVDGVLTADPRKVKMSFTIPNLTYAEAMEMSHFGAKVIYPPTIQPALIKNIPIYIKNTFNPEFTGSRIDSVTDPTAPAVKGISSISNIALLSLQGTGLFGVPGIAARLFSALAQEEINVILITQGSSEHSISFAINPYDAQRAKECVELVFLPEISAGTIDPVKIEKNLSVVAIIGENMRYRPGIAGRLFQSLGKNGINVVAIAQGSSELNISVVIQKQNESKALNVLHEVFFLSEMKVINLFMIGVGLIGSTLIEQIVSHADYLRATKSLKINMIGIANSKKMVFSEKGIDMANWKHALFNSHSEMDVNTFIDQMKSLNLPNSIFIDNTASSEIASTYFHILDSSISISTPNKIATSSDYNQYIMLKEVSRRRGVLFSHETNVGAGLPIITTLNDLINSGDRILKIEGVLSGSLSYIFNNLSDDLSFQEVILEARELGLTEPDPRLDLCLTDFKRKLVILGREAGIPLEIEDIESDNLLNEGLLSAENIDEFLTRVAELNRYYLDKTNSCNEKNQKLRVIGKVENKKAKIKLVEVDEKSPFYALDGSDNMVVFTTDRYNERPLVVKGPGAGAEVTAAGVFSEVITIATQLAN